MRQIILDTETTGFDPAEGDRIVELGCVELIDRQFTGNNLHIYFNPDRDSSPGALEVHGLTTEFLSQFNRFEDEATRIFEYLKGTEIYIHNASFDVKFLNAEFARVGMPSIDKTAAAIHDTLAMAREQYPGKRNSLDMLCERLGISNAHRTLHGALLDAELLAEVWLAMTRGQFGLVMEHSDQPRQQEGQPVVAQFDATVLRIEVATEAELAEHAAYLDGLDQAAGGLSLWRKLTEPAPAA
ncbi:DNA polymerase III subunit epsilon [Advenella kashmirensis WT001]|uniref:DNA polymerase III subunit epsilon n=1 Tax=Advenella kashmirensis (strain DSM 17095 / LMG 22695 / WT001) TaxID=1036672 RepID=I3U9V2_ADVKW|nr:DNA polymerase III subunit epsilon [Advenella kashmirensis]AFK61790.1 DNA polymerase III subunit epsilon [Advenella kashmirensis WT001]